MSQTLSSSGTKAPVTLNLPQLQNLCKRDPAGYKDDYKTQSLRFDAELKILLLDPGKENDTFVELMQFMAAVVSSAYRSDAPSASATFISLLKDHGSSLHPTTRRSCAQSLILLRNRGLLLPEDLAAIFFDLMSVSDKQLRSIVYAHVVNDVKSLNKNGQADKANRKMIGYMHRLITSSNQNGDAANVTPADVSARRCVDVAVALYKKRVWTSSQAVNMLATAALSPHVPIMVSVCNFFLGIEDVMAAEEAEAEADVWAGVNEIEYHQHSKTTKKRTKHVMKQISNRKKAQKRRENRDDDFEDPNAPEPLFAAIEVINDPYGLAEGLLKRIKNSGSNRYKFGTKLTVLNFITRLVGVHSLIVLPLYPFIRKYLSGHQKDVTNVLAYMVQATHSMVPPDDLKGLLKTVAHEFISERCTEEQMAVGINAARAVCTRVPSILGEDDGRGNDGGGEVMDMEAFVRDIAAFGRHRDKSVAVAAKGFINFVRENHPKLLQGKHRGLVGTGIARSGHKLARYGELGAEVGVEGAELLVEYERRKAEAKKKREARKARGKDESDESDDEDEDGEEEEEEEEEGEEEEVEGDDEDTSEWKAVEDEEEEQSGDSGDWSEVSDSDSLSSSSGPASSAAPALVETDRSKIRRSVTASRIFSSSDYSKMRRLVERERAIARDPRLAAKRKRAERAGEFELLEGDGWSGDDGGESDEGEEGGGARGIVTAEDIMAEQRRRRLSKVERLESIRSGREEFESKRRSGGSTNNEKKRKKNFLMAKMSYEGVRKLQNEKQTRHNGAGRNMRGKLQKGKKAGKHMQSKRRRK